MCESKEWTVNGICQKWFIPVVNPTNASSSQPWLFPMRGSVLMLFCDKQVRIDNRLHGTFFQTMHFMQKKYERLNMGPIDDHVNDLAIPLPCTCESGQSMKITQKQNNSSGWGIMSLDLLNTALMMRPLNWFYHRSLSGTTGGSETIDVIPILNNCFPPIAPN